MNIRLNNTTSYDEEIIKNFEFLKEVATEYYERKAKNNKASMEEDLTGIYLEDTIDELDIPERASNILNQAKKQKLNISDVVKTDLLKEEPEQNLYNQYVVIDKQLEELLSKKDYANAINKLNDVKPYLDNFLEKVMVMCEDENIKINRISLINYITEKFNSFVNLSSLQ